MFIGGQFLWGQPANLVWNTQSRNASESMPCGGGDIGMNVWVENDDVLFYLSRSGSFDENNCLLKQGRFRVRLTPNPFAGTASFRQTLHLNDGYVSVSSDNATLIIWVDVFHPVVHVEVKTKELTSMRNFRSYGCGTSYYINKCWWCGGYCYRQWNPDTTKRRTQTG